MLTGLLATSPPLFTPLDVVFLLFLISQFNYYRRKLFISDNIISRILHTSERSIREARSRLEKVRWLTTIQGRSGRATQYLDISCPGFDNNVLKARPPYFTVERSIVAFLLETLGNGINPRHIVAYLVIRYFKRLGWGGPENLAIGKGALRKFSGMGGIPDLIMELSRITLSDGKRLFKAALSQQKLTITGLGDSEAKPKRKKIAS